MIEDYHTSNPITPTRKFELQKIMGESAKRGIFVTAFENISAYRKCNEELAWETEIWIATEPKNDNMIDSKTTYFANLPNCYLIIENVPCKKCTQCGEEVFSMSVIERIDQIIASVKKLAGKVCVLEYQSAA